MREGLLILGDHLPNPHTGAKSTPAPAADAGS
jgi:hypothetical protein